MPKLGMHDRSSSPRSPRLASWSWMQKLGMHGCSSSAWRSPRPTRPSSRTLKPAKPNDPRLPFPCPRSWKPWCSCASPSRCDDVCLAIGLDASERKNQQHRPRQPPSCFSPFGCAWPPPDRPSSAWRALAAPAHRKSNNSRLESLSTELYRALITYKQFKR